TTLSAVIAQGARAGLRAALDLRPNASDAAGRILAFDHELEQSANGASPRDQGRNLPAVAHPGHKKFVCVCEDVTEKDVCDAIGEGFDHVETLKRYTTFTMGPCQGKMCALATLALAARENGRSIAEVGTTTARPPYHPVALGALAGPHHEPVKVSPIHQRHTALGAQWMDTGEWKRPRIYGPCAGEVSGGRERVGLMDVRAFGKTDVQGRGAVRL